MPVIRRTAQAEEDLIDLWLYIAQDNPGAADRLLDEIEDKCSLLADHPQLGPARPDIAADCVFHGKAGDAGAWCSGLCEKRPGYG